VIVIEQVRHEIALDATDEAGGQSHGMAWHRMDKAMRTAEAKRDLKSPAVLEHALETTFSVSGVKPAQFQAGEVKP
jgi:hypothetical protein